MNRKMILVVLVAAALVVIAITQFTQNKEKTAATATTTKPKAGYDAPVVQLPDLQENMVQVGGASDKVRFINFWAAWCGPCELEAPELQEAFEKYGDKISFLGVNSTKHDRERSAREFVDQQKLTFPILMDRDDDATVQYKVSQYPTSFVVDRSGKIVERINGVVTLADFERIVKEYASDAG
ncbi:TlpA family protein disulfide reductase [Paenibacillus sp. MMS18-CY102]|uniref:TlpA family protein disulfide reductase n=1 Tax=Paenibacillus sp. MMS18-CY102 TaxID=2682849 RepID=UPI001365FCFB|nr:TlpA disulfide reductase family protein [Paenibacillus sp. MMS18-CY102]MWC28924.1 redoxin domain-containing protein [Paenibacillus sp. MMS18-CY102]